MKCPKCGKTAKYNTTRDANRKVKQRKERTDFSAICNSCGWEGDM